MGKIGNIDHLEGKSRVELFDWQSGKRLQEISDSKFKGLVEQMVFAADGKWFLAAGGDHKGFLSFYETQTGKLIRQDAAKDHVYGVAFNEDQTRLYAVHHSRLSMWELRG